MRTHRRARITRRGPGVLWAAIGILMATFVLPARSAQEFDLCMSHPLPGYASWHGGPGDGGHTGGDWYIRYGMDLGAPEGSPAYAAFNGHVTKFHRDPERRPGVYGSQIFVRNTDPPADHVGVYYTHLQDVPDKIREDANIARGEFIGNIAPYSPPHLHMALVEIVGGAPSGKYVGVSSLNGFFKDTGNVDKAVRFYQREGAQPQSQGGC